MAVSSLSAAAAREHADADGDDDRGHERAQQQVGAEQVGDGHAGEDRVRQRVAEERHGAQHDEGADHRAQHADDERGEQRALHELQRERVGEPGDHRGSAGGPWPWRCSSPSSRARAALVDHDHAADEDRLAAEGLAEVLLGEDGGRLAVGDQPAVQQGRQLEALRGRLHVVRAHEHGDAPPAQAVEEREQGLARAHVHAREGLVQQQHVRLLGERPGEEHALLLAAGELADGAPLELGDAELVQAARHHLAVGGLGPAEPAEAAVPAHHDDVVHGDREAPVDLLALGHVGDRCRRACRARGRCRSIVPERTGRRPTRALKSVDLPAPLGPTIATCAPCGTLSVTSSSAGRPP